MMDMNNMMGNWGWSSGGIGMFFMLIFWILIIVGLVFLVMWLVKQTSTQKSSTETAIEILKQRYAKGEISKEEFEEKKKDLV